MNCSQISEQYKSHFYDIIPSTKWYDGETSGHSIRYNIYIDSVHHAFTDSQERAINIAKTIIDLKECQPLKEHFEFVPSTGIEYLLYRFSSMVSNVFK